ncbi:hypothetical protein BJX70DRAFT_115023 [Aspergillus crustosus]
MGWQAMRIYGAADEAFRDLVFVVPDEMIEPAKNVLEIQPGEAKSKQKYKYPLCTKPTCMELVVDRHDHKEYLSFDEQQTQHPRSEYHFHASSHTIVYLIRKSDHLWWLPKIELGLPDEDNLYLTVSTVPVFSVEPADKGGKLYSPRLTLGPWPRLYPVRILRPGAFIEALLWLQMRDFQLWPLSSLWGSMNRAMQRRWEVAHKDDRKFEHQWLVGPRFQRAWAYFRRVNLSL